MKQNCGLKSPGAVVTVGTFDGLHRGHESVLATLRDIADSRSLRPLAVTFDRHPMEIVMPGNAPELIMDIDERDELIQSKGIEVKRVQFTEEIRKLSCREWLRRLVDEEGMKVLVLGYDNTFGSDGIEMSVEDYRELGRELGVEVTVAPMVPECSSSAARRALNHGDVAKAAAILGRPVSLSGTVVHGREIGRTIGFPTANICPPKQQILPAPGVYSAEVSLPDGSKHLAVVNVGNNPTVSDREKLHVEAHLFDFDADLYGDRIRIDFIRRLRDERKFNSLAELHEAISIDIAECRATEPKKL